MARAPVEVKSKALFSELFSRHAVAYQQRLDEIMARGEAAGRERVIEAVDARRGMRILDLACGPGTLSKALAARVAPDGEVVGVDLAPGMVEVARAAGLPNARFEVMDIEQLDFGDESFDAAACGHGLQFVPDLGRALREVRRVLRRNAAFAASVPAGDGGPVWAVLDRVVDRRLPPAPEPRDSEATRAVVNDSAAFRQALVDAGFARARIEVIEEVVVWDSAEQLISRAVSWWDLASRVDALDVTSREAFIDEAVASVRREHTGRITTVARNHVAVAVA